MLPHRGTNNILPDPTIRRPVRRSPDPTPPETPPHLAGDPRLGVTTRPRHTSVRNTTRRPQPGIPSPKAGCPTPLLSYPTPPREIAGVDTSHEVAANLVKTGLPAIHEPIHSGKGTPHPSHSLTWRTHLSSPAISRNGPLLRPTKPQHPTHGYQSSYRNNGSTPTAQTLPDTHAWGRRWYTSPPALLST